MYHIRHCVDKKACRYLSGDSHGLSVPLEKYYVLRPSERCPDIFWPRSRAGGFDKIEQLSSVKSIVEHLDPVGHLRTKTSYKVDVDLSRNGHLWSCHRVITGFRKLALHGKKMLPHLAGEGLLRSWDRGYHLRNGSTVARLNLLQRTLSNRACLTLHEIE